MVEESLRKHIDFSNLDGYALSRELFAWLIDHFNGGETIVELGSGTGTKELRKFFDVFSVESDLTYVGRQNGPCIYAPVNRITGWYHPGLFKFLPKSYQVFVIDGPKGSKARKGILDHCDKICDEAYVVIDDTHRTEDLYLASTLAGMMKRHHFDIKGHEKNARILLPLGVSND